MNNLLETTAPERPATKNSMLLLHCGAEIVDRRAIYETPTPIGTDTWYPLSHGGIAYEVEDLLINAGFQITGETHALSHEGARYFGLYEVQKPGCENRDYTWCVGLRNSHDKSITAGLVAGTKVMVCDNLSFCGEVKISRKHTRYAARDLRHLTARAVGQLGSRFHQMDERIEAYRRRRMTNPQAHDLLIKAIDCRAITPTQVPGVLHEWREPEHEAFRPRTAWSLFNAATEVMKGVNPNTVVNRTQALHGLFDGLVGLS